MGLRFRAGEIGGDLGELVQRGLQVFDDFGGKNGWVREIVGVLKAFIAETKSSRSARLSGFVLSVKCLVVRRS